MEPLEVQVVRHDEQIKAIREELRSGFDRLEAAFKTHAADDTAAHAKADAFALRVNVSALAARRMWGLITIASGAGSAVATAIYHIIKL